MPTLTDYNSKDSIGIARYDEKQIKGLLVKVKREKLLESDPPDFTGHGIVIAGGGSYLAWTWVLCRRIRDLGCQLPIQIWHIGEAEMPRWIISEFANLGAETVDALTVMKKHPVKQMSGWILKNYAITHCPYRHAMFIDADCFPSIAPEKIFEMRIGTLFFNDVKPCHPSLWAYVHSGLDKVNEWETGQFIVDKVEGWMGLRWTGWLNEHSDLWFKLLHGDKGTFEFGFRLSGVPYSIGDFPKWKGYGIGHSVDGVLVFEHKMATKRKEWPPETWLRKLFSEWSAISLGKKLTKGMHLLS